MEKKKKTHNYKIETNPKEVIIHIRERVEQTTMLSKLLCTQGK